MKKIYRKPNLAIESFATENVMTSDNALISQTITLNGQEFGFLNIGEGNVLNSIDYTQFNNN